jgi:hypothetical protein
MNIKFVHSQSKDVIGERLLYEQFSTEIYSNINSFPFSRIYTEEENENSNNYLNVEVKLDPYFDCKGVKKGLLNEICQDKLVNNFTCCKSECCIRTDDNMVCSNYSFNLQQSHYDNDKILNYNEDELYDDPRRRYCYYFNKYIRDTHTLSQINLYKENYAFNYVSIISNEDSSIYFGKESKSGYTDCGEIDTLKNHLYVKDTSCPVNYITKNGNNFIFEGLPSYSFTIFVRNIISEIPPNIHEWKNEYEKTDYNYLKEINKFVNQNSSYYKKMDVSFNIEELSEFYNYEDKVNKHQEFYWYTTNYIGFESHEELKKFFEYFDENDNTNNNLYKISKKLFPSYTSLIFGVLLIIACLLYTIYLIIILVKNKKPIKLIIIIKKIIDILTTIGGIIYYVVCAHSTYRSINIKMDKNYMEVLNLYNKRRKQIYFLYGIIIISFNLIYEIFLYFFKFKSNKELENISNSEEEEARRSSGKRSGKSRSTDDPVVYGRGTNGTPSTIRHFSNSINNDNDNDNNINNNNNNELSININNRNN